MWRYWRIRPLKRGSASFAKSIEKSALSLSARHTLVHWNHTSIDIELFQSIHAQVMLQLTILPPSASIARLPRYRRFHHIFTFPIRQFEFEPPLRQLQTSNIQEDFITFPPSQFDRQFEFETTILRQLETSKIQERDFIRISPSQFDETSSWLSPQPNPTQAKWVSVYIIYPSTINACT